VAGLADFLEKLSSDEAFEAEFDKHPRQTMKDFGLGDSDINLVLNGTAKQIREKVHQELPGKDIRVFRVKMG